MGLRRYSLKMRSPVALRSYPEVFTNNILRDKEWSMAFKLWARVASSFICRATPMGASLWYHTLPRYFSLIPYSSPRDTIVKLSSSVVDPDPLLIGLGSGLRIMNYRSGSSFPFIKVSMKFQKKATYQIFKNILIICNLPVFDNIFYSAATKIAYSYLVSGSW